MRLKRSPGRRHTQSSPSFNTKKVRLKLATAVLDGDFPSHFQYQKGAIKTQNCRLEPYAEPPFQYQKDAIKTYDPKRRMWYFVKSFNTKKVRLKLGLRLGFLVLSSFQYQKGAIKTQFSKFLVVVVTNFQYQKGAIKTETARLYVGSQRIPFNTKKVRLKRYRKKRLASYLRTFNTKKVRLKLK